MLQLKINWVSSCLFPPPHQPLKNFAVETERETGGYEGVIFLPLSVTGEEWNAG